MVDSGDTSHFATRIANVLERVGIVAAAVVVVGFLAAGVYVKLRERRTERRLEQEAEMPPADDGSRRSADATGPLNR